MKNTILITFLVFFLSACSEKPKQSTDDSSAGLMFHKVKIEEVIQTSSYTYLLVEEKGEQFWTAVSKGEFTTGEEIFYFDAKITAMQNFHSQELNRDFDSILFIAQYSKEKGSMSVDNKEAHISKPGGAAHSGRKQSEVVDVISVEKAKGGITIAELYANRSAYANKTVRISGEVMKVNLQIMGRNWVHIQDGTKSGDDYDLTVTTQEILELGDQLVIEGVVAIDKDFTSGYFYPVIVEDAKVVK